MYYENIKQYKSSQFQRLVGVQPATFQAMVDEVKKKTKKQPKKKKGGRPFKYSVEDQVLMTLMYWREYRTMFHIGGDYGISESAVCRTINRVENILSKSKKFQLPGKKELEKTKWSYEVYVVDATESPIERPKKNSTGFIQAKRSNTH
jgi:predicted DNA-binding protein YlxM (UPF0122 family)